MIVVVEWEIKVQIGDMIAREWGGMCNGRYLTVGSENVARRLKTVLLTHGMTVGFVLSISVFRICLTPVPACACRPVARWNNPKNLEFFCMSG